MRSIIFHLEHSKVTDVDSPASRKTFTWTPEVINSCKRPAHLKFCRCCDVAVPAPNTFSKQVGYVPTMSL
jgi:hypothetical protein